MIAVITAVLAREPRPAAVTRFSARPARRWLLGLAAVAAVVISGLAASGAEAAVSCSFANDVVDVRMTADRDAALLSVDGPGAIRVNGSACATATVFNTDAVLVKDASDNPATTPVNDGNTLVSIEQPARFGPGKTDELSPLEDEIEIYVDTNGGTDTLWAGDPNARESQALTVGNGGLSWTGDGDADVVGMQFDEVALYGGFAADSLSGQAGRGTGGPLSNPTRFYASGSGGADVIQGSDIATGDELDGGAGSDAIDAGAGNDTVYFNQFVNNPGDDTVVGGTGMDRLDFNESPRGVTVDLARTNAQVRTAVRPVASPT